MAHTASGGAAKRTVQVIGKRLGIKKFAGQHVISGNIIVRQRGTRFHAGLNTMVGRDHTIFATAEGYVNFRGMTGTKRAKKYIDVLPERKGSVSIKPAKAVKAETKTEEKEVEVEKKTEKKPAKPKATTKKPAAKKTSK